MMFMVDANPFCAVEKLDLDMIVTWIFLELLISGFNGDLFTCRGSYHITRKLYFDGLNN